MSDSSASGNWYVLKSSDPEQLKQWLSDQPAEISTAIAARTALRVLPLCEAKLHSFRAAFLCWAKGMYPTAAISTEDTRQDEIGWGASGGGPADLAARHAIDAAAKFSSAEAGIAAFAAVGFAADAADMAAAPVTSGRTEIWDAVWADIEWLSKHEDPDPHRHGQGLMREPLWLRDVRGDPKYRANFPPWARAPFDELASSGAGRNRQWKPWIDWYRGILPNSQTARPRSAFGAKADLLIAEQPQDFWAREEKEVMADIGRLVRGEPPGFRGPPRESAMHPDNVKSDGAPEATVGPGIHDDEQRESGEIVFIGDAPRQDDDLLHRSELAFILAARLNRIWNEINALGATQLADSHAPKTGHETDSSRWSGELGIAGARKRNSYASNTADESGFVVHLDAPWGGGKTTFANYLAQILSPYAGLGPLPNWLKELPLSEEPYWPRDFHRPWHIVRFNAWQHQHVDPPWWCFYQAIRKQIATGLLHDKNVRANSTYLPKLQGDIDYCRLPGRLREWLTCWTWEIIWRLFTPELRWKIVGTLATVGLAVFFVSLGWLRVDVGTGGIAGNLAEASGTVATLIAILAGGGAFLWTMVSAFTGTLLTGTPDAAKNYSLGSGDPLERFRYHFGKMMKRLRRPVLVIVDDIDRCDPSFVVELLRGMQTILKSPRLVFLLLGDRDWIEHSFAEVHKAMQAIPVGPEHSFGARFVEKAIQLSVVLPDIPAEERHSYVRSLLGAEGVKPDPEKALAPAHREEITSMLAGIDEEADPAKRDRAAASLRDRIFSFNTEDEIKEAIAKEVDRKVALRSAADDKVRDATRHRLEPVAMVLPPNPRQIKRIINAISLFQEIARIRAEVQPETQRWRQLALWIVLMTEWPQTWATLTIWPELLLRVHEPNSSRHIPGLEEQTAKAWASRIGANRDVMKLLNFPGSGTQVNGETPEAWRDAMIDVEAVRALRTIMPVVGGANLPEAESRLSTQSI